MAVTYTINNLKIISWEVDTTRRSVHVVYQTLLDTGEKFDNRAATFWETMPLPEDYPHDDPDTWYQLPPAYSQMLTDLTVDARAALMHLVNPV